MAGAGAGVGATIAAGAEAELLATSTANTIKALGFKLAFMHINYIQQIISMAPQY